MKVAKQKQYDLGDTVNFKTSSFSGGTNCVAVAKSQDGSVKIRHSKNIHQRTLNFTRGEWTAFVNGVKNDEFDVA